MSTDTPEDPTITGPVHDKDSYVVQIDQPGVSALVRIDTEQAARPGSVLDVLGAGVRAAFEADAARSGQYGSPDTLTGGVAPGAALSLADRDGDGR